MIGAADGLAARPLARRYRRDRPPGERRPGPSRPGPSRVLCNAGTNLSRSGITLTAIEIDQGSTKVASASGSFTFNAKITSGGGYQYNVSANGLIAGQGITHTLKCRVSTDVAGVYQYATFSFK